MHQDYSENYIADEASPTEQRCGQIIVDRLLKKELHGGPFEHPQNILNIGYFPHSVMQQARTHRTGCSFDCQSFRYTGSRVAKVATGELEVEEVFYLRPVGNYADRFGKKYTYDEVNRLGDIKACREAAERYRRQVVELGYAEEQARGLIPFDTRQHFVVSFNARSLMHFLDMRSKLDAQQEIRWLCELLMLEFEDWMPEVAAWYKSNRYTKARLAP